MANKSIKISIATALNAVGITAAKRALISLAENTKAFAKGVASNLMNIKAGFDIVAAGARKFLAVMSKGMEFERMTTTFKSLTGSLDLAKAHMKDLQDLGRTPPFSLELFASASQMMMKMTDGMLGYKSSLEMVGDIAAATGSDISQVGRAVGLAYQIIRDGQPFGRAGSQLVQLGVLTKKQVEHFDELTKSGKDNAEIWAELENVLGKYKGAMAETEKTAKGMVEAIEGEATVAMTEFSSAITETAKPALEGLLGFLKRINDDGTIEVWADKVLSAFDRVATGAKAVIGPIANLAIGLWKSIKVQYEAIAQGVGGAVGALSGGGGIGDAWNAAKDGVKSAVRDVYDTDGRKADAERENRETRAAEKAKRRAEESAKAKAEAEKRIAEDLAKAKAEADRKAVEEAEKKTIEAAKKQEEEYAKESERLNKEETALKEKLAKQRAEMEERYQKKLADEQTKIERKRHDYKMKKLDEEAAKTQEMIDRLLARGADNPMARAGGGGWQRDEIKGERQAKLNDKRIEDEQKKLEKKARDKLGDFWEAALDDPEQVKKLGRLSNIQKAALEKLKLDKEQKKLKDLEEKKQKAIENMDKTLDDIKKKLAAVGL